MIMNVQDGENQFLKELVHSFQSYSINGQKDIATSRPVGVGRPELAIEQFDPLGFCCLG